MIMKPMEAFENLARLGSLVSKPFARQVFRLLVIYEDISASEAASRLDLHIKTAQDFLEGCVTAGLAENREVMEGKRPYQRYRLKERVIGFSYKLDDLRENGAWASWRKAWVREKADNTAVFTTDARHDLISSISLFEGEGRGRKERKINLTRNQGKFFFHLPFPNKEFKTVEAIMEQAGLETARQDEVIDLLLLLHRYDVVERK